MGTINKTNFTQKDIRQIIKAIKNFLLDIPKENRNTLEVNLLKGFSRGGPNGSEYFHRYFNGTITIEIRINGGAHDAEFGNPGIE